MPIDCHIGVMWVLVLLQPIAHNSILCALVITNNVIIVKCAIVNPQLGRSKG